MATTAYLRLRMFWGALDLTVQEGETPGYTGSIVSGGTSAVAGTGNVGVRRVQVHIDRTTAHASADAATMHFDWLNITGGDPDDSWITSDFTTMETKLDTFFTSLSGLMPSGYKITGYSWYRVGTGVTIPNPAVRTVVKTTPISCSGSTHLPPQAACSITFRTGVRHSWGRTYFPLGIDLGTAQTLSSGGVDTIAAYADTLVTSAASSDFVLVVVSKRLSSSLNVEHIEVDDVTDVIRRRRWKSATYKKILP